MTSVFIPGNVPSLKDSQIKTKFGIFPSKTVKKYLRTFGIKSYSSRMKYIELYKRNPENKFLACFSDSDIESFRQVKKPFILGMEFIRGTRHRFDYVNASHIILDLLTAHDIIPDDDADNVIPYFFQYLYDKDKPGVYLKILDNQG